MTKDSEIMTPEVMTHIIKNLQREVGAFKKGVWILMTGTWVLAIKLILQSLGVDF